MDNIINEAAFLENLTKTLSTDQLLSKVSEFFADKIALASSFSIEDQVVLDMLWQNSIKANVFTLDTGRLPQETYDVIEKTRKKYGITIEILYPDYHELEKMVSEYGPNLFYENVELRKQCCKIRKINPLKRKLSELNAWICGLRSEQSSTRKDLHRIEADSTFNLIKVSPLIDWTTDQVWDYIRKNNVPYNRLHDQGYPSIGCQCCTRPVQNSNDIRSGRWWWELPEHKECGIHLQPPKKTKAG